MTPQVATRLRLHEDEPALQARARRRRSGSAANDPAAASLLAGNFVPMPAEGYAAGPNPVARERTSPPTRCR